MVYVFSSLLRLNMLMQQSQNWIRSMFLDISITGTKMLMRIHNTLNWKIKKAVVVYYCIKTYFVFMVVRSINVIQQTIKTSCFIRCTQKYQLTRLVRYFFFNFQCKELVRFVIIEQNLVAVSLYVESVLDINTV